MNRYFLIPFVCFILGVCLTYFALPSRSEVIPIPNVDLTDTRAEDEWSPKPFSQSTKKYIADDAAGGVSYALAILSPHLTEETKVSITQDYQGVPNDATQKHVVAAELVDCALGEDAQPVCNIIYSETETRIAEGEYATVLWESLTKSGYFKDAQTNSSIILKNIFCTIDSKLAQTSPGNYLYGFSCSFET